MKKFTQVKKTIIGTEYTAQFNGIAEMYKSIDNTYMDGRDTTSMYKMAEYLLKNVLVEPKKNFDDFEDTNEFNEVLSFLGSVHRGTFREETDESTAEETGKK
ncbi:MAG: hypothetical protein LUD81_05705 [Clostridiales bacterium]|nr:hypothetical protein [Clostridiales bacterium]